MFSVKGYATVVGGINIEGCQVQTGTVGRYAHRTSNSCQVWACSAYMCPLLMLISLVIMLAASLVKFGATYINEVPLRCLLCLI